MKPAERVKCLQGEKSKLLYSVFNFIIYSIMAGRNKEAIGYATKLNVG